MKYTIAVLIGAVAAKKAAQTSKMLQSLYTNEWQCWDDTEHTDSFGDGCDYYYDEPDECGVWDDDDFKANDLCCACESGEFDDEEWGGYWA